MGDPRDLVLNGIRTMTGIELETHPTRRALRAGRDAAPAAEPAAPRQRDRSRAGGVVADLVLWVAAILGTACVVLVILAMTMGITLIMFKTGSMSPTIPAGSVAVVQRIQASEIRVGDVVTVDRAGQLPVTHRVTSIVDGAGGEQRIITMRGDANTLEDPFPYTVESARVVLFSVPGIASVIVGMGNPYVIGGLTVGASLLVVWAFWPREGKRR